MSKAKFNKLPIAKKRIVVAQDVLDRIRFNQFTPNAGSFCKIDKPTETVGKLQLSEKLQDENVQCTVCAKGGLFLAYIGIVNNFEIKNSETFSHAQELKSKEMKRLSSIFSEKQLTLIEVAFEGRIYGWNINNTASSELAKCILFYKKFGVLTFEDEL